MKKINVLILLITAFALVFSACSKDDDDFDIVGTWTHEKTEVTFSFMGMSDTETDPGDGTVTFNSDHSGYATDLDGNKDEFTWQLSGRDLTIIDELDGDELRLKLTTRSSSRMVAEVQNLDAFGFDFDFDPEMGEVDIKVEMVLIR